MTTFNEYRKQQQELLENTLYTDATSKQAFVDNEKSMMSAFMFNFFGMLLGYNLVKNKQKAIVYFKSDLKLQLNNITDDNNNMSLIIKLLSEKGAFKSPQTPAQITRFLVKLKQNSIDEVDSEILVGWMNGIKDSWWSKLGSHLKVIKEEFIIDKDQYKAFETLRARARIQKDVAEDFFVTFKGLTVEPAKITKWSADMLSQKSIDSRLANIGGLGKTLTQPAQATPVAAPKAVTPTPSPKPVVPEKQDWKDIDTTVAFFLTGGTYEDFNKKFKSTVEQRKSAVPAMLKLVFTQNSSNPTAQNLMEVGKYINDVSQAKPLAVQIAAALESAYITNKVWDNYVARMLVAQQIGILDKAEEGIYSSRYRYAYSVVFQNLIQEIIGFGATTRLRDVKKIVDQLDPKFKYVLQNGNRMSIFVNNYLRSKNVEEFMTFEKGVKSLNGVNTVTLTKEDQFDYDNSVIKYIMKDYNLERQSSENMIYAFLKDASYKYGLSYEFARIIERAYGSKPYTDEIYNKLKEQFFKVIKDTSPQQSLGITKALINYIKNYEKDLMTDDVLKEFTKVVVGTASVVSDEDLFNALESIIGIANDRRADQMLIALFASALNRPSIQFKQIIRSIRNSGSPLATAMPNFIRIIRDNAALRKEATKKIIEEAINFSDITRYNNVIYDSIYSRNNAWDILSPTEQTQLLNDMVIQLSKVKLSSAYGIASDIDFVLRQIRGDKSEFMFKDLNADAKKAYIEIFNVTKTTSMADPEFYAAIDDETLQKVTFDNLTSSIRLMDDDKKGPLYDRFFAKKENKDSLLNSSSYISLNHILQINEFSDVFKTDIESHADKIFDYIHKAKRYYDATDVLQAVNTHDFKKLSKEQKDGIFKRTLKLIDDPKWIKKQTSAYKDKVPDVQEYFDNMVDEDRAQASAIYANMTDNMRMRMAESYLTRAGFSGSVDGLLHNNTSPIVPYEKLDKKRIKEILKYNNVSSSETNIPSKYIKTFDTMDEYIKNIKDNKYSANKLEDQKVEVLTNTQEELDKISVDLHRNKRNGKHGDVTLKVLRTFNVAIPLQEESQKTWIEANPTQEIINPMFHGTGSIGASMILRYGFRVISSGDSSVVGRMLGDGIYGSNIIDKAQQYVGDKGFGRTVGTKGYVFLMNAALGEKGKDYKVAGLGNDSIRSPEWCVFTPNSQFKIFKAYEVQLINEAEIKPLLAKYPQVVTEKSFKDYLNEEMDKQMNYTTYTFITGIIPNGQDSVCDFEEWKSPSKSITLEPSAYGPTIVVAGTPESNDYIFTSTADFRTRLPEEYEKFISYFK